MLCGSDIYNHGSFYNSGIWCCHTTATELESVYESNYTGHEVKDALLPDTMVLNWQNGVWAGFAFDYPFDYNGFENLIIEFRWQGDNNLSVYDLGYYTSGNRAVNASSSTAPTGVPRNYMPRMRIFYNAVGVAEERSLPVQPEAMATFAPGRSPGILLDAMGRRATASGPGVYFLVRPDGVGTKVILAR